jgi:hypothetical protein
MYSSKYLFTKLEIKPTSKQVVYDENSNLYKINKIDDNRPKSTPPFSMIYVQVKTVSSYGRKKRL